MPSQFVAPPESMDKSHLYRLTLAVSVWQRHNPQGTSGAMERREWEQPFAADVPRSTEVVHSIIH